MRPEIRKKIAAQTQHGEDLNQMTVSIGFSSYPQGSCGVVNRFKVDDKCLSPPRSGLNLTSLLGALCLPFLATKRGGLDDEHPHRRTAHFG